MITQVEYHCKLVVQRADESDRELERFTDMIPFNGEWFDFRLDTFVPMPEWIRATKDGSAFDWALENWSCPYEPLDGQDVTINRNSTVIHFVTHSAYPYNVILSMSWRFPTLWFTFAADNGGNTVYEVFRGGQLIKSRIRPSVGGFPTQCNST